MSVAGGVSLAVDRAALHGCEALQIFAKNANRWQAAPLDPKLGPLEMGHIVRDAAPAIALGADVAAVEGKTSLTTLPLTPALREGQPLSTHRQVDDAPLLILYTSGTTGLPKGAVLSARNVAFDVDALAIAWKWTPLLSS